MKKVIIAIVLSAICLQSIPACADVAENLQTTEDARQKSQGSKSVKSTYVCVRDEYALVGWADDNVAGSTLYKKTEKGWSYVYSGGGSLSVENLVKTGMSYKTATALYNGSAKLVLQLYKKDSTIH